MHIRELKVVKLWHYDLYIYIYQYIIDYQYDYNCVYTPVLDRFLTLGFIPRRPFYPDTNSRRFFCADSSEDLRTLAVVRHAIRCLQHWEFHLKSWRFTRNHGISPASFLTGYPLNMLIAGFPGIESVVLGMLRHRWSNFFHLNVTGLSTLLFHKSHACIRSR